MAIGSVASAIIGDWISGVFERDLRFSLGGANQRTRGDNQEITTPLGQILGLAGQGNFGSLNDPNSFGGQIAEALTQFDTGIADILGQFATDEQFTAVTDALEDWVGTWGETATVADVLSSRFNTILGQFSTDIQELVRGAEDFEGQIERFGVALATDKLIRENPDVFNGRAAGEILNLVAAMQSGSETMGVFHRLAATAMMGLFAYHLIDVAKRKRGSGASWIRFILGKDSLVFNGKDLKFHQYAGIFRVPKRRSAAGNDQAGSYALNSETAAGPNSL